MKITDCSRGKRALESCPRSQEVSSGIELAHHADVVAVTPKPSMMHSAFMSDCLIDVLQLVGPVDRVDGHRDRADLGGGEQEREPVGNVGGPDAEVVALADADGKQAAGKVVHAPSNSA